MHTEKSLKVRCKLLKLILRKMTINVIKRKHINLFFFDKARKMHRKLSKTDGCKRPKHWKTSMIKHPANTYRISEAHKMRNYSRNTK